MSLIKNLKRQEIEIFGAKKVVRNKPKEQSCKEITNKNKKNNLVKKGKNNERN